MKRFIRLAAVAAAFALCIHAPTEGAQPVTSSVQIPLDISFILTFNPDTGALVNVDIESMSLPVPR